MLPFTAFSYDDKRGQHMSITNDGNGESNLFVMTKVLFGDSRPPGPVAVEMLRQKHPELSEPEAEALLRQNSNDLDMAVQAVQQK